MATTIDDVQRRLDSYRTDGQRRRRMKQLKAKAAANRGYYSTADAIENCVLWSWLETRKVFTAQQVWEYLAVADSRGELPKLTAEDEAAIRRQRPN